MAKISSPRPRHGQKVAGPKRGAVYLCAFDPTVGHEIQKARPALVIQNDVGNRYSSVTIVAAITSAVSPVPYPVEVVIAPSSSNGLTVQSSIRLDQIRTVDRERLIRRLGLVDAATMSGVDAAIKLSLGLVDL